MRSNGSLAGRQLAVLLACELAVFADVVGVGVLVPAIPEFADLFGASDAAMGYAFSAFSVAFLIAVIPLGLLVDATGRRGPVVVVGVASIAASALVFAGAGSLSSFALGQALHGLGSAAVWVGALPSAAGIIEGLTRKGLAYSSLTISMGLGLVAGPLIGSIDGLRQPFLIYLGLTLIACVVSLLVLGRERDEASVQRMDYRLVLGNRQVLAASLTVMIAYAAIGMAEVLFPLYMASLGHAKAGIGILFFLLAVALVLSQPLAGHWMDRAGALPPALFSFVTMAAVLSLAAAGSSFAAWTPAFLVLGIGEGALVSTSMAMIAASSAQGQRGLAYAVWNFSFGVGYLIGPLLGGALTGAMGGGGPEALRLPFYVMSGLTLLLIPVFLWLASPGHIRNRQALRERA